MPVSQTVEKHCAFVTSDAVGPSVVPPSDSTPMVWRRDREAWTTEVARLKKCIDYGNSRACRNGTMRVGSDIDPGQLEDSCDCEANDQKQSASRIASSHGKQRLVIGVNGLMVEVQ